MLVSHQYNGTGFFQATFCKHSRVEAVHIMAEYVSQGIDGFLMNDNDPTRPMVMYYHNLIMQYAEQGDVQSVRHNLRLVKGSPGALARALHLGALGDGRVLKVLLEAAGTAATAELKNYRNNHTVRLSWKLGVCSTAPRRGCRSGPTCCKRCSQSHPAGNGHAGRTTIWDQYSTSLCRVPTHLLPSAPRRRHAPGHDKGGPADKHWKTVVSHPKLLSLLAEYDVAGAPPRGLKRAKAIVEKCGDWFTPENLMAKGSAAGGLCR